EGTTDLSSLRTQILTTCAVVSRVATRTRSHSVEISETSCPDSPSMDAPASPSETTDTDFNVGEPNHITRSLTTPLEIPLEPVQNDTLTSTRTSLSRCSSPKGGVDDVSIGKNQKLSSLHPFCSTAVRFIHPEE
ncbi:hypothetical protein FBUS_10078, partial [Fasciolopsis buskii]